MNKRSDMEKPNTIMIDKHDHVTLLKILGDLTSYSESYLEDACRQVDERTDINNLVIVFESDAYINSGGIAVLMQMLAEFRKRNRSLGIIGLSYHNAKIFKMVGINQLATIFGSLDEALASMG
jgi:anti-anti-sigma factor